MRTKPTHDAYRPLGHRYPPPLLLPVEKIDAHSISVFAFEATAASPMQSYFYPSPSDRTRAIKALEEVLLTTLSNPAFTLMKAVDPETKQVASYAVWEDIASSKSSVRVEGEGMGGLGGMLNLHTMPLTTRTEESGQGNSIGDFIASERAKFKESWANDVTYIELQALATSPRFQRRGYASALLAWGHKRADAESKVSFLLGSPIGRYLYASLGWKEVGQIVIDMTEWMEGAGRGDLGWGVWKLYHMIMLPRAVG